MPNRRDEETAPIADWKSQTIQVESIVGRDSYLDPQTPILENQPTEVRAKGWETQPLGKMVRLRTLLDYLVTMKCQQNLVLAQHIERKPFHNNVFPKLSNGILNKLLNRFIHFPNIGLFK